MTSADMQPHRFCIKIVANLIKQDSKFIRHENDGLTIIISRPSLCTSKFYVNKMSKHVCSCGTNHDNPLVITITACQNKHHGKHKAKVIGDAHPADAPAPTEAKRKKQKGPSINSMDNSSEVVIDHLLYCEEEDLEALSNKTSASIKANANPVEACTSCPGCETEPAVKRHMGKTLSKQKSSTDTPLDRNDTKPKKELKEKNVGNRSQSSMDTMQPHNTKTNVASNYPSDSAIKLPILIPRYHGPGCAMEVNVLEKHDAHCSYRKVKNAERSPTDDRSGSYEVIGRIIFKTCQQGTNVPMNSQRKLNKPSTSENQRLTAIYSLFNVPLCFDPPCKVDLSKSKSEREIQALKRYLKRKRVFESLVKSSKSFPTNLTGSSTGYGNSNNYGDEAVCNCQSLTSFELEELYFFQEKTNKAVQMTESCINKHKQKRWFYFLFPCLYSDESYSSLILHAEKDVDD